MDSSGVKRMAIAGGAFLLFIGAYTANNHLKALYANELSKTVTDRNGEIIAVLPNTKGHYVRSVQSVPQEFSRVLLEKEDRYFWWHPGINPLSVARATLQAIPSFRVRGASTLTQQLTKNLLRHENDRGFLNKLKEAGAALSLELFTSKKDILAMYANTAYFGNQAQGIGEAANYYFGAPPDALTHQQSAQLLASLNNPEVFAPGTSANRKKVTAQKDSSGAIDSGAPLPKDKEPRNDASSFELRSLGALCAGCKTTIDRKLTEKIRDILARSLAMPSFAEVQNGAVVVLRLGERENEVLSLVGSPHPYTRGNGWQINMAVEPRPVGSTAKPFIYARAFEKGARPYSSVDDEEYRYTIGTGFSFYPKNYDGQYRGRVTLHQALDNSLNVPSVKVLEWVGVDDFNDVLMNKFGFLPRQPIETYQLGMALGGLEMDLLTLTDYFTVFPQKGALKPLRLLDKNATGMFLPPMAKPLPEEKRIFEENAAELIDKVLSDRLTGIDQFGLRSNLNLTASNYAVKTGTTYDYHDSWTVGYTPDFVVGVWLGNSDNTAIKQVSGSAGAGKVWHDVMELLLASPYNTRTPFDFKDILEFTGGDGINYGLEGDDTEKAKNILLENTLILSPHDGDVFTYIKGMVVPLRARGTVRWYVNGEAIGEGDEILWNPSKASAYRVTARNNDREEFVSVSIQPEE